MNDSAASGEVENQRCEVQDSCSEVQNSCSEVQDSCNEVQDSCGEVRDSCGEVQVSGVGIRLKQVEDLEKMPALPHSGACYVMSDLLGSALWKRKMQNIPSS
jgi:hypothetical protein